MNSKLSTTERQAIEAKAEDLLQNCFHDAPMTPPIDLGKIAASVGLHLKNAEFDDSQAIGLFDRNKKTIYVAKGTAFQRSAFTIAHELGHYILHLDKNKETYWRMDSINIDKQDVQEEQEANLFGATLLMPTQLMLHYWNHIRDIQKLSTIFGVSQTAMLLRLKHMNLISSEE